MNKRGYLSERIAITLVVIVGILGIGFLLAGTGMLVYTDEAGITGRATEELPTFSNQIEENATEPIESNATLNQPPEFIGTSLRTPQDTQLIVDLATLFTDPENDELTFLVTEEDVISVTLDGSMATFVPESSFTGLRLVTIAVSDDVNLVRESVKFVVEAEEIVENVTLEANETVNATNITENVTINETIELNETNIAANITVNETVVLNETNITAEINLTTTEMNETNETNTTEPEPPSFPSFSGQTFTSCEPGPVLMNVSTTLTNDLATNNTCIEFNNDNITLDCNGFQISYTGSDEAVFATGRNNISVINCEINDFSSSGSESAIEFVSSTGGTIRNNFLKTNGSSSVFGIYLREAGSNAHVITNNTIINLGTSSTVYGIYVQNEVHGVNITNNTVISNGTTSVRGIRFFTTAENHTIENNVVRVQPTVATGNNYGVDFVTGIKGYRILNNTIRTHEGQGDDNYGISLISADYGLIANNTILAGGTSFDNKGIVFSGTDFVNVSSNIINSGLGTSSANNNGIEFSSSSNNSIDNNTIVTDGSTANNHGIDINSGVTRLTITRNRIFTNGSTSNEGITMTNGDGNIIANNTIVSGGDSGDNLGIGLFSASTDNNISNNIIMTDGSEADRNFGIYANADSAALRLINNTIITGGTFENYGILLEDLSNATIINNTINTSGTTNNQGIRLLPGVNASEIRDNFIITNGTSGGTGIFVFDSRDVAIAGNTVLTGGTLDNLTGIHLRRVQLFLLDNNTVTTTGNLSPGILIELESDFNSTRNNNITAIGTQSHAVALNTVNSTRFVDTVLSSSYWINTSADAQDNRFTGTTFEGAGGSIQVTGAFTLTAGDEIDENDLNVTGNAFVNSTSASILNQSARVTLRNLAFNDAQVIVDENDDGSGEHCFPPQCFEVSYDGSTFVFDVQSFTTYLSAEGNLSVTKNDSVDPVGTGDQFLYSILLEVSGNNASNTTVTETYPDQVVFISAQPTPLAGTNNTFIVGNLTSGQIFVINITVQAISGAGATINNTINVTYTNSTGSEISFNLTETTNVVSGCPGNLGQSTTLGNDITTVGTCMNVNASNVTIDCAGFTITYGGDGMDKSMGVNVTNTTNVTIQNCNIVKSTITGEENFGIGIIGSTNVKVLNTNITTNGSSKADGIRATRLTTALNIIRRGEITLVDNKESKNNPACTNATGLGFCQFCFSSSPVDCANIGQTGCTDGAGFKTEEMLKFNTSGGVVPEAGLIEMIGGEIGQCFLNGVQIGQVATSNNCGAFKAVSFQGGFVLGENNLSCRVAGGGTDEDNGFKLSKFVYVSPKEVIPGFSQNTSGILIGNVTINAGGGAETKGIFLERGDYSNITDSTIGTAGAGASHGIETQSHNVSITSSTVTLASGDDSYGVYIREADVVVAGSTINTTNTSSRSHAIFAEVAGSAGNVENNTVDANALFADALHLEAATGNIYRSNNVTATRAATYLERALNNIFNNTFIPASNANTSLFILEPDGSINFTQAINLTLQTNFSTVVNISLNFTFVNATDPVGSQMNTSAALIFFGVIGEGYRPMVALNDSLLFESCPFPRCSNATFNRSASRFEYDITQWSAYSGRPVLDCSVLDLDFFNNETNATFRLEENISSNGNCFQIAGENITFDCSNYSIFYDVDGVGGDGFIITPPKNVRVENCTLYDVNSGGANGYSFDIQGTDHSVFWNNTMFPNGTSFNSGFHTTGTIDNVTIERNEIHMTGSVGDNRGIHFDHTPASGNNITNITILNNLIEARGPTSSNGDDIGIQFDGPARDIDIIGNNISSNSTLLEGIFAQASGMLVGLRIIANNFSINDSESTNVHGIFVDSTTTAAQVHNSTIENNTFISVVAFGGSVNQGITIEELFNTRVVGNTIRSGQDDGFGDVNTGIAVDIQSYGNTFERNNITALGDNNNLGISLSGARHNFIAHNQVTTCCDSSGFAIEALDGDGIDAINVTVLNNTIVTGRERAGDVNDGIHFNADDGLIQDNRVDICCDNSGIGIRSIGNNTRIFNNTVLACCESSTIGMELRSPGIIVENNTIVTSAFSGQSIFVRANHTVIRGNTIVANDSGTVGIFVIGRQARNITIIYNNISTGGDPSLTNANYGIYLQNILENITVMHNTINTSGLNDNFAIYVQGRENYSRNILVSNNIINTTGASSNNIGIYIFQNVSDSRFENNTIRTNGTNANYGMLVDGIISTLPRSQPQNNTIVGNIIVTNGSGLGSYGIAFRGESSNFTVQYNDFVTSGLNGSNHGAFFSVNASGHRILDNNFTATGNNSYAVFFENVSNDINFTRTIITGSHWIFVENTTGNNTFTDTTFDDGNGSIRIIGIVRVENGSNITKEKLNFPANEAFLNSSNLSEWNQSGIVTLRNVDAASPFATVDFEDDGSFANCNSPQCTDATKSGSEFSYNVSSFTTYSFGQAGGTIVEFTKSDAPDGVNQSSQLNYTIIINVTQGNASNVTVNETYPEQVIFLSGEPAPVSGTNTTFIIGNLTENQTVQMNITVFVINLTGNVTINNTANLTFQNETGVFGNATVTESTFVIGSAPVPPGEPQINITSCPITVNVSSTLTQNLFSNGTCITIRNVDNLTVDCAGFNITYGLNSTLNDVMGFNITNATNVTVTNCNILKENVSVNGTNQRSYGIGAAGITDLFIENNTITSNGTLQNDGIRVDSLSTSSIFTPKGVFTIVEKGTNINNPVCTNLTGVSECDVCFDSAAVSCTAVGNTGCPDGEFFRTETLVRFNTSFVPDSGDITVIGGEIVFCDLNDERVFLLATGNNCGAVKSATFSNGFVAGENNLTCGVTGSGEDEDSGFKLASFSYTSPQSFNPGIIRNSIRTRIDNVTIISDGGDNSRGVFLNAPFSNVTNSIINSTGNDSSHGIYLVTDNITVRGNRILTNAGKQSHALDVAADNSFIEDNIINTTGGNQSHGILLDASRGTRVDNNTISVTPIGADAINVFRATGNNISNNTINRAERASIAVDKALPNTFTDSFIPLQPAQSSLLVLAIDGIVNYTDAINLSISTNLSQVMSVTLNNTFVNSSDTAGAQLNRTAILTFFGLSGIDNVPVVDLNDTGIFLDCATSRCRNATYNSSTGIMTYNVTDFTTYAARSQINCGIVDLDTFNNETNITFIINRNFTSTGTCLTVFGENVTITCNSTSILYDSDGVGGDGIVATNGTDLIIENCFIRDINAGGSGGAGIILNTGNASRISNNTIITNGTSSNIGVSLAFGGEFIIIENNTILTFGTSSSNDGIRGTGGTRGNQYRSNIIETNGTGSNAGIEIFSNNNNNHTRIFNNTINTTGTGSAFGINMQSANNVTIESNVIRSGLTGSSNFGISLGFSTSVIDALITGNIISTRGTSSSNYGIDLSGNTNNVIANNSVNTTGTDQNYGLFTSSDDFIIRGNTISTNGSADTNVGIRVSGATNVTIDFNNVSTDGGDCCNDGMDILGTNNDFQILNNNVSSGKKTDFNIALFIRANGRLIANNFVSTAGTEGNEGIFLDDFRGGNMTVENNTVMTSGSAADNPGIDVESDNNNITGNVITTNGSLRNYGIWLAAGSSNNYFDRNNVTSTGGSSPAIRIIRSNFSIFNNTILFDPPEWINSTVDNLNNFTNTTFEMPNGSIRIIPTVHVNGSQQVSKDNLNISDNLAFLNSTDLPFLNTSAVITLRGITFTDPEPGVDFNDDGTFATCSATADPFCNELSFAGATFVFNTTHFTGYTAQNSTIINSTLTNCTVINSVVINSNKSDCTIIDSTIINSNNTNSTIINSTEDGSNNTNTHVYDNSVINASIKLNSRINNSNLTRSNVTDCVIINSTVVNSAKTNCTIINSIVLDSNNTNTSITNSNETNSTDSNMIISDSDITDSIKVGGEIDDSTITDSNLTDVHINNSIIDNSNLTDCVVINSTVINSFKSNCTIINSIVLDSNNTNTSIRDSNETNSTDTNIIVLGSTIINSTKNGGEINNSNITESNITDSFIENGTITNSNVTNSTLTDCIVENSTVESVVNSSCTYFNVIITPSAPAPAPPPPAPGGGGGGGGGGPIGGVQPPTTEQPAPIVAPPAAEEPDEPVDDAVDDVVVVPDVVPDVVTYDEVTVSDEEDCVESWTCTGWSACFGVQNRKCVDKNMCRTAISKPDTWQFCNPGLTLPEIPDIKMPKLPQIDLFKASLWILILMIVVLVTYGTRKFSERVNDYRRTHKSKPVVPKPAPKVKTLKMPKSTDSDLHETRRSLKAAKSALERYRRQLK